MRRWGCQGGEVAAARNGRRGSLFLFPLCLFLVAAPQGRADGPPPVVRLQKPEPEPADAVIQQTRFTPVLPSFPQLNRGEQVGVSIRAQVNGAPIFDEQVRLAVLDQLKHVQARPDLPDGERLRLQGEILTHAVEQLVDREVVLQDLYVKTSQGGRTQYLDKLKEAAAKEVTKQFNLMKAAARKGGVNVNTDEDLRKILLGQGGLALETLRRERERDFIAREYMLTRVYSLVQRIGHQEIKDYYEQHPNEFEVADSVKWQDIFIDAGKYPSREQARAFAGQLADRAGRGVDFDQLIAQYGRDSIYKNGEGYGHRPGEIRPAEAEPVLFKLHDGQVGPVIELASGFHVIRLVQRQYAGRRPLDDATQSEIRKKLQNEVATAEMKRFVAELRAKAVIEIVKDVP